VLFLKIFTFWALYRSAVLHCEERDRLVRIFLGAVGKITEAAGEAKINTDLWRTVTERARKDCADAMNQLNTASTGAWLLIVEFGGARSRVVRLPKRPAMFLDSVRRSLGLEEALFDPIHECVSAAMLLFADKISCTHRQ